MLVCRLPPPHRPGRVISPPYVRIHAFRAAPVAVLPDPLTPTPAVALLIVGKECVAGCKLLSPPTGMSRACGRTAFLRSPPASAVLPENPSKQGECGVHSICCPRVIDLDVPARRSAGTCTGTSPSTSAAASTAASGSARTRRSRTRGASGSTWSRRCGRCRSRTCAGRAAASPTSTTGGTASGRRGPAAMVNTHWGDVEENNHFGTHEFMALCELLGAEPYVSGNVGSGTVQEMSEWVEYLTRTATARWSAGARRTAARSRGGCRSGASATRRGAAAATCAPSRTPIWPGSTPRTAATTATTSCTGSRPAPPMTTWPGPRR